MAETTVDPIVEAVVSIVSELTGYPPELLDLDLDLEADLGVDTVKQAEVFAAVREQFGVERDEHLKLRDFPTLNHVVGWVADKTGRPSPPARGGGSWPDRSRRRRSCAGPEPAADVAGDRDGRGRGVDRVGADGVSAGAAGSRSGSGSRSGRGHGQAG